MLTVLVTWFIARRIGVRVADLGALGPEWTHPRWLVLVLACVVLVSGNLLSGIIWGVMVRDLGGRSLPKTVAVRIFLVANLGRYVPGKLWQIAGLALLSRRRGVTPAVATGAAVLGHGLSLVAATLVGATVLLRGAEAAPATAWIPAALVLLVGVGLLPPVFRGLVGVWKRLATDVPEAPLDQRRVLRWLGMFLVNWVVYAGAFVVLALSFDVAAAPWRVGPAFVAAYVLGYVALFAPAGIGVREVALTGLLAPSVGATAGAALAVVARVWTTVVEVVPGALLWSRELHVGPVATGEERTLE